MEEETQPQPEVQTIQVDESLMRLSRINALIWLDLTEQEEEGYRELAGPEIKRLMTSARLMTNQMQQQEAFRQIEEIGSYGRFLAHAKNLLRLFAGVREEEAESTEQPEEPATQISDNVVQLFRP